MPDLTKEIHDDVKRVRKKLSETSKNVVLAALTLGSTLACNSWLGYMFEKFLGSSNSGWAKFLHALVWVMALSVLSVKFSRKSKDEVPPASKEKDKA